MTSASPSTRRRGAKLLAAAGLLGAVTLLPALPAGAQPEATFSASPTTASSGDIVTFTATGCVIDDPDATTYVVIQDETEESVVEVPTDDAGTAVYVAPVTDDAVPGSYDFEAICTVETDDSADILFYYEDAVTVTITASTPTTTAPSPTTTAAPGSTTSTTAAPAASAAVVTPRFAG